MSFNVAVLGAGDCFRKMLSGIRAHFNIRAIYDPDRAAVGLSVLLPSEATTVVSSEDEIFGRLPQLDALFILSPPAEHARQLYIASQLGKPVFVEKPLAIDKPSLQIVLSALSTNPRTYFSDFYVDVRGASLVNALHRRKKEEFWIKPFLTVIDDHNLLNGLLDNLGRPESIAAKLLERTYPSSREWLYDPLQGGVLLDLAYHLLALFFAMFSERLIVKDFSLASHPPNARRTEHKPWTPASQSAETYASLRLCTTSKVTCEIEVGNCSSEDRAEFCVRGAEGEARLVFSGSQFGKNVLDVTIGAQVARVSLAPRYWDLVALGFYQYLTRRPEAPHGFLEGKSALEVLLDIKKLASDQQAHSADVQ